MSDSQNFTSSDFIQRQKEICGYEFNQPCLMKGFDPLQLSDLIKSEPPMNALWLENKTFESIRFIDPELFAIIYSSKVESGGLPNDIRIVALNGESGQTYIIAYSDLLDNLDETRKDNRPVRRFATVCTLPELCASLIKEGMNREKMNMTWALVNLIEENDAFDRVRQIIKWSK